MIFLSSLSSVKILFSSSFVVFRIISANVSIWIAQLSLLLAIRLTQMARSGQTMGMKIEVAANKAELKRLSGDQYYVDPKTVPPFLSQYGKKGPAEVSPNTPSKKQLKQMKKAEKKAEKERRKVSHKAYKAAKKQGKVY